jgi:hypothetical protein
MVFLLCFLFFGISTFGQESFGRNSSLKGASQEKFNNRKIIQKARVLKFTILYKKYKIILFKKKYKAINKTAKTRRE